MSTIPDLLRQAPLLDGVSAEAIKALGAHAELVELAMGKPLQRAGQLPSCVALVLEGRLRRLHQRPGHAPISLGQVLPGEWLGWAAVLRGEPDFTITASERSVLLRIPL